MKDWKEEFHKRFVQHYYEDDIYNFYGYGDDCPQVGSGKEEVDKVIDFIEQEIEKAREEGREEGMKAILYPKFRRDENGTIKREGWVDTSKLTTK